ncbi:MAG: TIGR03905 family TSCPD domain-containing protein [Anaerovoracaceae bacterium]
MTYKYITKGTCSREITVEMEGDVLKHVSFYGGCNGNLQGISTLVEGMTYDQLKDKLSGIRCGFKSTSCPDQLVKAVEEAMAQQRKNG